MSSVNIPPLKFRPILKSAIWGGEKIAPFKGITTDQTKIGESWEISGVKGNESVVANGPDAGLNLTRMIEKYGAALVGQRNIDRFGNEFPLLIKIIDAASDLSLQVHPDDELAKKRHNSLGKTEMWYIVDTDPDATILSGLSKPLTPEQYKEIGSDPSLLDYVACHKSHPGDVYFLPAGRIHGIGGGNLLVEVQETSDITYRIYDYGRVDAKTGKPRELHVDAAKDAIDYTVYHSYKTEPSKPMNGVTDLVHCSHFDVYRVDIDGEQTFYPAEDCSFSTFTCIEGELEITDDRGNTVTMHRGESVLIPAMARKVIVKGKGAFIDALN